MKTPKEIQYDEIETTISTVTHQMIETFKNNINPYIDRKMTTDEVILYAMVYVAFGKDNLSHKKLSEIGAKAVIEVRRAKDTDGIIKGDQS